MAAVKKVNGKVYIEGVRKVSWDTGEMCEFASCFVSAMRAIGTEVPYAYVVGTAGVSFRFTLNAGEWDYGNYSIRNISENPYEPIHRAFAAAGYGYTLHEPGAFSDDAARIMGSIDRGIPVLAFAIVGPSDCSIITGYDEGGAVLLGWSTFQDIPQDHAIPPDDTGYFRKPGWHENMPGYILLGEQVAPPSPRSVYLDALRWAVYLMRTPQIGKNAAGLRALEVWANEMAQEKNFPVEDEAVMSNRYLSAAINMTMLRDHCLAEPFLSQAAADVPEFQPELSYAAGRYGEVKRLRDGMDALIGDNFSEQAIKAIEDPSMRRAYAAAILSIRDIEEEALSHIEKLLDRV